MSTETNVPLEPKVSEDGLLDSDMMLTYFISMLGVRVKRLEPWIANDPVKLRILSETQAAVSSFDQRFHSKKQAIAAWCEAYRLERLLALVEPPENLISEIQRRLDEADEEKVPVITRLRTNYEALALLAVDKTQSPPALRGAGEGLLRSFLLDVLEELHWAIQRKYSLRPLQKEAAYKIVYVGLVAFVALLFPFAAVYWNINGNTTNLKFENYAWVPLYITVAGGLFGALFSRLLFLQTKWSVLTLGEIRDAQDFSSILLRGCVGMTGAVVVSFFLQSGILSGGIFPKYEEIGFRYLHYVIPAPSDLKSSDTISFRLLYPNPALALLVVWSFLAGFSERLVPSILQSTEASIQDSSLRKK